MTPVRRVLYDVGLFADARVAIGALVAEAGGAVLVRAPAPERPAAARANVACVLRDLEAATTLDPLSFSVGAQVVGGSVLAAPVPPHEAPDWVRRTRLSPAA
jgi:hypothetical protein